MRPLLALAFLTACAGFPEVDRAADAGSAGAAPRLVPTGDLLAQADAAGGAEAAQATLAARAAALRARADRIRAMPVS